MNNHMNWKKLAFGLILIIAGILFLLERLNQIPAEVTEHLFSWQAVLVAIGVVMVAGSGKSLPGWIVMAIGVFFLLSHIFLFPATFRDVFWPLLLIAVGVLVVFKTGRGKGCCFMQKTHIQSVSDDHSFEDLAVFGGNKKSYQLADMKTGKVTAIFGGSDIDLRDCTLSSEGAVVEILCLFGGSKLIIPKNWKVRSDVLTVFGGMDEQGPCENTDEKMTVYIKGMTIFGGGEIVRS